jgi:hypothetical protein
VELWACMHSLVRTQLHRPTARVCGWGSTTWSLQNLHCIDRRMQQLLTGGTALCAHFCKSRCHTCMININAYAYSTGYGSVCYT